MYLTAPLLWYFATFQADALSTRHPGRSRHEAPSRSWLSRARDSLIQSIWQIEDCTKPSASTTLQTRYGGDCVLRFDIKTEAEAKALADATNVLLLDVWEFSQDWVDIRISKDVVGSLLGLLPASIHHVPLIHDVAHAIYDSYPSPALADPSPPTPQSARPFSPDPHRQQRNVNIFFRDYQPLSVIMPWLRLLRSLFPTHVRLISIGTTYEGREIPAVRVGVHPTNSERPSRPRKTIVVTGGSHAREWISVSTVNFVAYSFITAYGRDRDITKLLESFDFLFLPTLNPDGYEYTWQADRLWRKNRQQTSLRFCPGFDLDRAFGFRWDSSNSNPCSESFSGERPFEAVEASRFSNFLRNETDNNNVEIVGFIDLHSYSRQILYPYSYSCTLTPPNLEDLEELATGLANAIHLTNGERYGVISACEGSRSAKLKQGDSKAQRARWPRIETGGGSALDWMYHEMGVSYSFQLKLGDTGFLLPSENIVPTGKEVFEAVKYLAHFLNGKRGIEEEDDGAVSDIVRLSHPKEDDADDGWVIVEDEYEAQDENAIFPELRRQR